MNGINNIYCVFEVDWAQKPKRIEYACVRRIGWTYILTPCCYYIVSRPFICLLLFCRFFLLVLYSYGTVVFQCNFSMKSFNIHVSRITSFNTPFVDVIVFGLLATWTTTVEELQTFTSIRISNILRLYFSETWNGFSQSNQPIGKSIWKTCVSYDTDFNSTILWLCNSFCWNYCLRVYLYTHRS